MKVSSKYFEKSLLNIADFLDEKAAIQAILHQFKFPETVKTLSYMMFVRGIEQYFLKDNQVYDSIQLMREYARELSENGYVDFQGL